MFGISFFEFIIICTIFVLIINPKDLPYLIENIIKIFYQSRDYFFQFKNQLGKISKDIGFDEIKNEVENNFNEEKIKNITEITDLYGIKHKIKNENSSTES
jgi:Sec-independent protein translocase protein TatA